MSDSTPAAPWKVPAETPTPRRCAACGGSYTVEVGETPEQADERHGEDACDAEWRAAAFFATAYGQGVLAGLEDVYGRSHEPTT